MLFACLNFCLFGWFFFCVCLVCVFCLSSVLVFACLGFFCGFSGFCLFLYLFLVLGCLVGFFSQEEELRQEGEPKIIPPHYNLGDFTQGAVGPELHHLNNLCCFFFASTFV